MDEAQPNDDRPGGRTEPLGSLDFVVWLVGCLPPFLSPKYYLRRNKNAGGDWRFPHTSSYQDSIDSSASSSSSSSTVQYKSCVIPHLASLDLIFVFISPQTGNYL